MDFQTRELSQWMDMVHLELEDWAVQQVDAVKMEGTGLVGQGDEDVKQDAESWSKLEPGICDMILEKLPYLERLRLWVVCKDWNWSALKRVERKPFFVTMALLSSFMEYQIGLVVYDGVSKSLSFKHMPFKLHSQFHPYLAPYVVEGLFFCTNHSVKSPRHIGYYDQWSVYNIHTRSLHVVPPAPGGGSSLSRYFCGMMVDTSVKPHTFKLVVSYSAGEKAQIYDSATRSWSLHPNSNPNSNSSLLLAYQSNWYFCMCHKGCMYMSSKKAVDGVLVYSMEEDQWSKLSGSPFRGEKRPCLGAWDDRIFAVLHDTAAGNVTVWELIDVTQQEWVEYARCPKAQYEQLMEQPIARNWHEIVSVFSEECVLMFNSNRLRWNAFVMLNLKTREWELVPKPLIKNVLLLDSDGKRRCQVPFR